MSEEKPRRHWFRFSLRTLFVLVAAFFAFVPLALIGYAALGGALGGLAVIGGLMLVQWPLYAMGATRRSRVLAG